MRMKRREFLAAGLALITALRGRSKAERRQIGQAGESDGSDAARLRPEWRRRPGCSNRRACIPTRSP